MPLPNGRERRNLIQDLPARAAGIDAAEGDA
ncbi:hypothetical protein SAMN04489717_2049 [Actinopolymorpha singaporensis]|uniref:Uncharacterized protein n=1 Tax=Actinopolymorpha singaporensis TaxID=117157 RepID=A0A1H1QLR1_9ACTN|nr:hypothetical protein SAMN04489717_2049 [Actinopolymorpha singaporensis]